MIETTGHDGAQDDGQGQGATSQPPAAAHQPPAAAPGPDTSEAVQEAWNLQSVWSRTGSNLKRDITRGRWLTTIAATVGAVLATLATTFANLGEAWDRYRIGTALLGAIILAVVPAVTTVLLSKERLQAWVRTRSASEDLKEQIYRYLVGVPPFGPGAPSEALNNATEAVTAKVQDLWRYAAGVKPSTRPQPLTLTPDGYAEQRVLDEIENYYLPKSAENARIAFWLRGLVFLLGIVAAAMTAAITVATDPRTPIPGLVSLGSWVAVVTTAGAAIAAHLAAGRYDHDASTFASTAQRLRNLRTGWRGDSNRLAPDRVARFVDECEAAISTENEGWLAERVREDNGRGGGNAGGASGG